MSNNDSNNEQGFVFGKINYILMLTGLAIIIIGLVAMIGGSPEDPAVFNPEEKYSFIRITLAPILILIGLAIEIFAIMVKAKE